MHNVRWDKKIFHNNFRGAEAITFKADKTFFYVYWNKNPSK